MSRNGPEIETSMVVATLGRSHELSALLRSLAAGKRRDFEVIIVDQNADDRLVPVLAGFDGLMSILHLRTDRKGVCRARNLGAAQARGQWLMFPDDDCWYPQDFLARMDALRKDHPADFYSGRATNALGETIMGDFAMEAKPIEHATVWTTLIEWMLVVKRSDFAAAGGFDVAIGPGSGTQWGAYEIQDLVLRPLSAGRKGWYDPAFTGHHPQDRSDQTTPAAVARMRLYSTGLGYVMRKHGYGFGDYLPRLLRPLAGVVVYAFAGKPGMARRSWNIFAGRWVGWRTAPTSISPHGAPVSRSGL